MFLGIFDFLRGRKAEYPLQIVGYFVRVKNSDNDSLELNFQRCAVQQADILGKLWDSPNRNILCCGVSGISGKTTLLEVLLNELTSPIECKKYGLEPQNAVIFSPKHFAENSVIDFDLGRFKIIDCAGQMINVFENREAFVAAWEVLVLNTIDNMGITASQIAEITGEILDENECKNWADFKNNLEKIRKNKATDKIAQSQLNWIETKIKYLAVEATVEDIPISNVIFYLGNLPNKARAFFYELFLQKLSRELELENKNVRPPILVLDEGHIVLKRNTITETFLRELRTHVAAVWVATQAFDDIDPKLRQFSFEPQGKTGHLKPYLDKPALHDCIGKLSELEGEYPFVDFMFGGSDIITVYELSKKAVEKIKQLKQESRARRVLEPVKIVAEVHNEKENETATKKDLVEQIVSILETSATCLTAHAITAELGYKKDDVSRLNIQTRVLPVLAREDKIRKVGYITSTLKPEDKPRKYYYSIPKGESQIHRSIIVDALTVLKKISMDAEEGMINQGWDILCEGELHVDAKTGLEHDLKDDVSRLLDGNTTKKGCTVIFCCVNYEVKKRYEDAFSVVDGIQGKYRVCCLNELVDVVRGLVAK